MSNEKLSREQVPQKFAEWLLGMGCPPEKVPSVDKISEICRGQYYMVWRSLMEHVEPKDVVKRKRLQVFCDDVQKWQKKSPFNERDSNVIIPEPIALWQQQTELKDKVADMETRVGSGQEKLKQLTDKISMKLSQRNLCRERIEDLQRRAWLLQQVAADLKAKKQNLEETRTIADSLCCFDEDGDVQGKFDKCLSLIRKPSSSAASNSLLASNPVASSSVVSTNGDQDTEDQVYSLVKSPGFALWPLLCESRAGLVSKLADTASAGNTGVGITPQSVLAYTAALHSSLALEAMKHKVHIKQTQKRLASAVNELSSYLTGEACELLVLRCERARTAARVNTLRAALNDIKTRSGHFEIAGDTGIANVGRNIAAVDRNIESKRDELRRLLTNLAVTEKKIMNIRECLVHIFSGFQKDLPVQENERYRGHLEFPQESIATLRQFYEERKEKMRNKVELSLDLDVSENCSFADTTDNANPRFIDELKIYLKKFCLEKNRKLVLESGEKIWISETLQSSHSRLLGRWQHAELPPIVCPSVCLHASISGIIQLVNSKETMEAMVKEFGNGRKLEFDIDLSPKKAEEDQVTDRIKKRLNDNLISLQKTVKTLDLGRENLKFWADNEMKKYISSNRKFDGKTYRDYEVMYKETLNV